MDISQDRKELIAIDYANKHSTSKYEYESELCKLKKEGLTFNFRLALHHYVDSRMENLLDTVH